MTALRFEAAVAVAFAAGCVLFGLFGSGSGAMRVMCVLAAAFLVWTSMVLWRLR